MAQTRRTALGVHGCYVAILLLRRSSELLDCGAIFGFCLDQVWSCSCIAVATLASSSVARTRGAVRGVDTGGRGRTHDAAVFESIGR